MSNQSIQLSPALYDYLLSVSLRESPVQKALRERTTEHEFSQMQIAPEQGQFMQMLIRLSGAKRCIEVGVFTGYSALSVAMALPDDGRLIACDINADWTAVGQPFWEEAGVAERIDLRIGPAEQTLSELLTGGAEGSFDFAFIDADKINYATYYELLLKLLRPGGLIAVDNTLWGGGVIDDADTTPATRAIRAFNQMVAADQRVEVSLVPIGDGLSLLRKAA